MCVWFGTLSSPLLKEGKERDRVPLGSEGGTRQVLGAGWEESWSFPQCFSPQGTARLAAQGAGERGRALEREAEGEGRGFTLTCKVQLPP